MVCRWWTTWAGLDNRMPDIIRDEEIALMMIRS